MENFSSDFRNASVYVGTYKKYNEGSLYGKWLRLADYADKDEFLEACAELHNDEHGPELMYQDWEDIPDAFIGESWISEKWWEVLDGIDDLSDDEMDAFGAWLAWKCIEVDDHDIYDLVGEFRDAYFGEWDSEKDFAEQIFNDTYCDVPEYVLPYIDYDAFARDLFIGDYDYVDGYVFRAS
jgi:antirestriction protein